MSPTSAKRPATPAKPPPAKRPDTGATKETSSKITPSARPGSFRLVNNLKSRDTDSINWPGLWLDDEMTAFLLAGKNKPQTAQEAHDYPGWFTEAKITPSAKPVPVLLIGYGEEEFQSIWVPSNYLTVMTGRSLKMLVEDPKVPVDLRNAYKHVLDGNGLDFWKKKLKPDEQGEEDSDGESSSSHFMGGESALDDEADEVLYRAATLAHKEVSQQAQALATITNTEQGSSTPEANDPSSARITMTGQGDGASFTGPIRSRESSRPNDSKDIANTIEDASREDTATTNAEPSKAFQGLQATRSASEDMEPLPKTEDTAMEDAGLADETSVPVEPKDGDMFMEDGSSNVRSVKTEPRTRFDMAAEERARIRRINAERMAGPEEARIKVGEAKDEFIVKLSAVRKSPYLTSKEEIDPKSQQIYVCGKRTQDICDPDDFEPIAEFMNSGDYEPIIVKTEAGILVLKDLDLKNVQLTTRLAEQCINLCKHAKDLELPDLGTKAIDKFKILASDAPSSFLEFLKIMVDQNYCNDKGLKQWIVAYASDHFFHLLDDQGKFKTFLQTTPDVAKMIFRFKAGLPAEEEVDVPTPKKRAPRKKKEPAADAPEPRKRGPVKKQTVAESKKLMEASEPVASPKAANRRAATKKIDESSAPTKPAGRNRTSKAKATKAAVPEPESDDDEEEAADPEPEVTPVKQTPAKLEEKRSRGRPSAATKAAAAQSKANLNEAKVNATQPKPDPVKKPQARKSAAKKPIPPASIADSEGDASSSEKEGSVIYGRAVPEAAATDHGKKDHTPATSSKVNTTGSKPPSVQTTPGPPHSRPTTPGPKAAASRDKSAQTAKTATPTRHRGKKAAPVPESAPEVAVLIAQAEQASPREPITMTQSMFNKKTAKETDVIPPAKPEPATIKRGSRQATPKPSPKSRGKNIMGLAGIAKNAITTMNNGPKTPGAGSNQAGSPQTAPSSIVLGDEMDEDEEDEDDGDELE